MGLIICPNCGKKTFNDEKCGYCKYPLKEKEISFETEKYKYLKAEYLKVGNKADVIKSGMKQFGISMQEAREIVDFIADEAYELERVRSKEQVDEQLRVGGGHYKFSLGEYLVHFGIYHIAIEALLIGAILYCGNSGIIKEYPLGGAAWFAIQIIFVLCVGVRFFRKASASFSLEPGNYLYKFRIPELRGNDGNRNGHYQRTYICYRVRSVEKIEEHLHSFVIYGKITKEESRHTGIGLDSTKTKQLNKVRIPKSLGKYKELMEQLKRK